MMASRGFARPGRSSSSSSSSSSIYKLTPEEQAELDNDWTSTYFMSIFFSAIVLVFTNFINIENALDDSGKPMKDKDGNEIKKLTTLGITLTVICSLIIAAVFAVAIYRNRNFFKKA